MTDRGSFKVQSDALRAESKVWSAKAANAAKAARTILDAVGQGSAFGVMAGSCGVSANYDTWSRAMQQALADAERCFDYIDAALVSTANAYDGVDATVAEKMERLNNMANLEVPLPGDGSGGSGKGNGNGNGNGNGGSGGGNGGNGVMAV